MEIFELRYFLGVAQHQNLHRAAEKLNVSPASLGKAVQRLENELAVKLFTRQGRNIKITDHGRLLQKKASEIVQLEEATRLQVGGHRGSIRISFAGPEVLLAEMGIAQSLEIKKRFPLSFFEYSHANDQTAIEQVSRGEAHLAIVTCELPTQSDLFAKPLCETEFHTYCGDKHPLKSIAKSIIPVEKILTHPFASPNGSLFGQVGAKQSVDGWRDDKFPRQVGFLSTSIKMLEELALRGQALVYLPDYYGDRLGLTRLKISGCPYSCKQKVKLVSRDPRESSWLRQIF